VTPLLTDVIADGARRFVEAEISQLSEGDVDPTVGGLVARSPRAGTVDIAGIGTTAAKAVRGALLAQAIAAEGYTLGATTPRSDPTDLFADRSWRLGVVLSPWKQEVGDGCDGLAPSARHTGVVDTILRTAVGAVGFNTNTWAAMSALEVLTGDTVPGAVLLLGAGASAASVALALTRAWPDCQIGIAARSPAPAQALAERYGGRLVEDMSPADALSVHWDVVVNTTTWGETEESEAEPLGIDLEGVLRPGGRLFDLNNRIGALQHRALAAGCAVVSGGVMQRVTNASRAALLAFGGDSQVGQGAG
jgi:shikimate dehydrogenase